VDIKENLHQAILQQKFEGYELKEEGILMYRHRFYVENVQELKILLLSEMHKVSYVGRLGYHKTIEAIKNQYYWPGMKKEVANFIARCLECQNVKAEHIHIASLLILFPFLGGSGKL
jgi:hypothetical protein